MVQNLRMKCSIMLLVLTGWGIAGAQALPPKPSPRNLPNALLLAQAASAQNQGSVLMFEATTPADEMKQLQVQLTKTVVALPVENTTLTAESLGAVVLTRGNGDRQRMDTYTWSIVPTSKLYLGRSGYKSLLARYKYSIDRQSIDYTLDIACQTVGLKTQDKATCSLFGNGPLLKGKVKATGKLILQEAPISEADTAAPEPPTPQAPKKPSSVFVPSVVPSYPGQGALIKYPTTAKALEQRQSLTRITFSSGNSDSARLTLISAEPKAKTIVLQGRLEPAEGGQTLTITAIDGAPAQGKVFVGRSGLLRTVAPIFIGPENRELTVYFRPN